ncbi:hypothetical protein VNO77_44771 [Canavalia gladiata]|uniref:Uncharacterized protein n=1 Tax=Canavalia gladiata TaxID=3824 RepID=A0AAN9PR11_CANGL
MSIALITVEFAFRTEKILMGVGSPRGKYVSEVIKGFSSGNKSEVPSSMHLPSGCMPFDTPETGIRILPGAFYPNIGLLLAVQARSAHKLSQLLPSVDLCIPIASWAQIGPSPSARRKLNGATSYCVLNAILHELIAIFFNLGAIGPSWAKSPILHLLTSEPRLV